MSAIEHEPGRIPSEAVELIKSLYVVEGAMAQDHGLDYLFGNIEILTALTRICSTARPSMVNGLVNLTA